MLGGVVCTAAALSFGSIVCTAALAQKAPRYPERPIRIVVGNVAGGAIDAVTRVAGRKLGDALSQTVIVDNRPGAGSAIALDIVAQASPDGYTLLSSSDTLVLNGVLRRVRYDVRQAFVPVAQMSRQMYVMVITPTLGVRTVKELIAYGKARPDTLIFGSQGTGSSGHIGMEQFKTMAGIDMTHVPYKGAPPALLDILASRIHLMLAGTISSAASVRSGKLRAVAVTGSTRAAIHPDVPTLAESGLVGFEVVNTYALFAPAGTPLSVLQTLNAIVARGMHTPETAQWLIGDGAEPAPQLSPAEFKAELLSDYERIEKIVSRLGLASR